MRLPDTVDALLFDMDGVLTNTAVVHADAWKRTFDPLIEELGAGAPFDPHEDYVRHVDGKSRLDGVRDFLRARGVTLPEGSPDDPPEAQTVQGVGRRKNDLVLELIRSKGVETYGDAIELLHAARAHGRRSALVSSSANAREALESAGIDGLFDAWVDGLRIAAEGLPGKPAPDTFLAAAADLGVDASRAAVLEDALAGVQAGRAGRFGLVVGVDRHGREQELRDNGADVVVSDLRELEL